MTSFNIYEAYAAVYNEDLREELLIEETILLESINELYDDELEEIVEDSIYNMLDEGYDIDEVEEIFEEILSEMNPYAPAGSKAARQYAQSTTSSKKSAERKVSRDATIEKIKGAVKSGVKAVKKTAGDIKSGAEEAKFKAIDAPAARYATRRGIGGPGPGLSARSKDPAKRRALRGAVVSDLTSRAKAKLDSGVDAVKSAGSAVKKGAKGLLGGAARAVSRGARDVARRLGEDVDLYDVVLEHLLDEGFADTEEAATVIMANMSEEWRDDIIEVTGGGKVEYKPTFRGPSGRSGGRISPQRNQDPQHRGMSSYPGHKTDDKINQLNYEKSKTPKASEKREKLETRINRLQTRFDRDGKQYQDYV